MIGNAEDRLQKGQRTTKHPREQSGIFCFNLEEPHPPSSLPFLTASKPLRRMLSIDVGGRDGRGFSFAFR
jgi:hypothetical protein